MYIYYILDSDYFWPTRIADPFMQMRGKFLRVNPLWTAVLQIYSTAESSQLSVVVFIAVCTIAIANGNHITAAIHLVGFRNLQYRLTSFFLTESGLRCRPLYALREIFIYYPLLSSLARNKNSEKKKFKFYPVFLL